MSKKLNVIGIIPARGRSKNIPKKNIQMVLGKPLIFYTIEVAKQCGLLERIIVSTEDDEIAEIARRYNAEVPFLRPVELSKDNVPDQPVFQHALSWLEKKEGYRPEIILNLRPTAPLRKVEDIELVIEKMITTNCDSVRTCCLVKEHPYWMYRLEGDKAFPFISGKSAKEYYQRQMLPAIYRINGCVDALRRKFVMESDYMYGEDMRFVVMPEERSYDIDNEMDLRIVETILRERK